MTKGQLAANIIQQMISLQISMNDPTIGRNFDPMKMLKEYEQQLAEVLDTPNAVKEQG